MKTIKFYFNPPFNYAVLTSAVIDQGHNPSLIYYYSTGSSMDIYTL